jgi:signal transduction histidine kinase/ActR/RegA family two-component response regulator
VAPGGRARNPFEVPQTAILTGVDGVERVFGNAVVERGPWLASVGIPTSVAMSRTLPILQRNFAISVATTLAIVVLTWVFARRWLSAFDHLDETAKRVSRGDLSPLRLQPMPTAEMDRLQGTVTSMITNLSRARESIAAQVDDERNMRQQMESLQQQVIRQERLAAIGVLVSGVAHELNNPLQAILGFAELLQMQQGIPEQARGDLTLIQKESTRASAIIRNLSRFGRQMSEPLPVRLRDVIASVLELRQRKLEELNIEVDLEEKSTGLVMAIFTELQQVVLNFAINAEQAIVHSNATERRVIFRTGDRDGWAWVEVEDSGPGVPPEAEVKLFQPFYTTKPVGEGTGLGLAMVFGAVERAGGRVWVYSEPGRGSTFKVYLPVGGAPDPADEGTADELMPGGTESILVLEDDDLVRDVVERTLRRLGYEVTAASRPSEALSLASERSFDLLVTDVVMPEMTGDALAREIRAARPNLPVVFMSGYTAGVLDLKVGPLDVFAPKPLTAGRIARAVREGLDRQRRTGTR